VTKVYLRVTGCSSTPASSSARSSTNASTPSPPRRLPSCHQPRHRDSRSDPAARPSCPTGRGGVGGVGGFFSSAQQRAKQLCGLQAGRGEGSEAGHDAGKDLQSPKARAVAIHARDEVQELGQRLARARATAPAPARARAQPHRRLCSGWLHALWGAGDGGVGRWVRRARSLWETGKRGGTGGQRDVAFVQADLLRPRAQSATIADTDTAARGAGDATGRGLECVTRLRNGNGVGEGDKDKEST
jgi:hypothetical protein